MCNKITLKSMFFCLSLLFFSLAPFCGSNSQAAQLYTISETQLNQLDKNLQTLEQHNKEKQVILQRQEEQLNEANKQLQIAKTQIENSKKENEQTQRSLEKANQSLTELEKEAKKKIRVKTRQRNMWIAISGLLATVVIAK